ncbi:vacuolar ATPase assembly integral membrane protein vma21-like [Babylonia areolata]|uniref:vacuolar ATPase assembly integral membrane protein vma21-like n=1 Tax=Babylonia areolata TaxID=304850 RepID=UPI003FD501F8
MAQDTGNRSVMKKMLLFTILMVFLPIFSYFFSKAFVFEGLLGMVGSSSYFYAAIVAIVVVHIILACFLYVAFTEDDTPRPQFKQD